MNAPSGGGPALHPLARTCVAKIKPHPLYANFRPGLTERINVAADISPFARYPSLPPARLKTRYREFLEKSAGVRIPENGITFTRGAVDGLDLLVRAFCEPGEDGVIALTPDFPEYERLSALNGNAVARLPLEGEHFDRLPEADIAASSAKMLFLCNPNNPVGSILALERIEAVLKTFKGIVVVDEVYAELAGPEYRSALVLLPDYPNLAVVRSFSKAWAMASLRIGAVLGGPGLIAAVERLQNPFALGNPVLEALETALSNPGYLSGNVALIRRRQQELSSRLAGLPSVKKVYPSHTNFVLARLSGFEAYCRKLQERGCLFVNADRLMPDCVQLTAGQEHEVDAIIETLSAEPG